MENTVCFCFCKKKKKKKKNNCSQKVNLWIIPPPKKKTDKQKQTNKQTFTVREPHLHNYSKIEYSQYDIKHLLFQFVKNKSHLRPTQGKLVIISHH